MKNCRIEEETDDSYINSTLIIETGTFRMDLKNKLSKKYLNFTPEQLLRSFPFCQLSLQDHHL